MALLPGTPKKTSYYGEAAQPLALDAAFVLALTSTFRTTQRQATLRFQAGDDLYAWYVHPVDFGGDSSNFVDGETGDDAGFSLVGTVLVAGIYCNVWRSNQKGLGDFTVVVK
jgi:hypothetical protein